jgi:hypothetical protein
VQVHGAYFNVDVYAEPQKHRLYGDGERSFLRCGQPDRDDCDGQRQGNDYGPADFQQSGCGGHAASKAKSVPETTRRGCHFL